jgi:hypothetical protein
MIYTIKSGETMGREIKEVSASGWINVSIPIEYIDYILDALKERKAKGAISEFVRDAILEKLAESNIKAPKYDTVLERYGIIAE